MRTRETPVCSNGLGFQFSHVFDALLDVALGSYHKEVNERSAPPVPFFRVDSRWVSNWHTERKSSRTQQSKI